jgi:GNAT superfamily N-acetyltransferase
VATGQAATVEIRVGSVSIIGGVSSVYVTELMAMKLRATDSPDPSARSAIADPLLAYNVTLLGSPNIRPLAVLIHSDDDAQVVGGLWGRTSFQWFFIPETLRSQGLGTEILETAEAEARRRGCVGAWLDIFSAEASRFYEKSGFQTFGNIDNYPPGNTRRFLLKRF